MKIVDFNPFCPITDSPLFTWSELKEIIDRNEQGKGPVFRIVSDPVGIVPSSLDTARLPKVIINVSQTLLFDYDVVLTRTGRN